jgi:tetratricopeptide (TPR) repeat protein
MIVREKPSKLQHRRIRRSVAWAFVVVLGLALTAPAHGAPSPKPGGRVVAVPLFRAGIRLFDQGFYQKALAKFQRAYFHLPNPKIHTRIALCFKWLGKYVQAIFHYEKYLAQSRPKPPARPTAAATSLRQGVQKTIVALLKKIGQIRLQVTAPKGALVRMNGSILGRAPMKKLLRLTPGKYHVTISAKDHHPLQRDLTLKAAQLTTLTFRLKRIQKKNRSGGAAADEI